jgi:hypothetical protein
MGILSIFKRKPVEVPKPDPWGSHDCRLFGLDDPDKSTYREEACSICGRLWVKDWREVADEDGEGVEACWTFVLDHNQRRHTP